MGSLKRRLERLEERAGPEQSEIDEEREKEMWLTRARYRRRDALSEPDVEHARSLIRLYRTQGLLSGMGVGELIDRILAWRPEPAGGRRRTTVEREVYLAIYSGEPGIRHMECPREWRESFDAGAELLRRYEAVPDEVLAWGYLELTDIAQEDEEAYEEWRERYEESYGITYELMEAACGPGAAEVTEGERLRRLEEHTAPAFYGEKGYMVARRLAELKRASEGQKGDKRWGA